MKKIPGCVSLRPISRDGEKNIYLPANYTHLSAMEGR